MEISLPKERRTKNRRLLWKWVMQMEKSPMEGRNGKMEVDENEMGEWDA